MTWFTTNAAKSSFPMSDAAIPNVNEYFQETFSMGINYAGSKLAYSAPYYVGQLGQKAVSWSASLLGAGVRRVLPESVGSAIKEATDAIGTVTSKACDGAEALANLAIIGNTQPVFDFTASELIYPTLWAAVCAYATAKFASASKESLSMLVTGNRTTVDMKHYDITPIGDPFSRERLYYTDISDSSSSTVAIGSILAPAATVVFGYLTFLSGKGIFDRLSEVGANAAGVALVGAATVSGVIALKHASGIAARFGNNILRGFKGQEAAEPVAQHPMIMKRKHSLSEPVRPVMVVSFLPNNQVTTA